MKITVYFGTGGVGKTSVSAATALARAREGGRCVVLTTDPALRLRTSLGLKDGVLEQRVPLDPPAIGELWAALLDVRATLDEAVRRHGPSQRATEILAHPIYNTIADSLSGMQELMAVERIDQLRRHGFEEIVIDTAPSRHALEILDKPVFFADLAGSNWVKLIGRTYRFVEGTGMMALGRKTLDLYTRVEAILGAQLVRQILDFYSIFLPVAEGYAERARKTVALLKNPGITQFRVVTTPQKASRDARFFLDALEQRGFRLSTLYVNRVWRREQSDAPQPGLAGEVLNWYRAVRASQSEAVELLHSEFSGQIPEIRTLTELDRDIDGVDALEKIAREMQAAHGHEASFR